MAKPVKCTCKAMHGVIKYAQENSWQVDRTAGLHLRFRKPGRRVVFGSGTPSDHRTGMNIITKLRRSDKEASA